MTYALIKNGKLKNIIILDDETLKNNFKGDADLIICIDNVQPTPGIGFLYDGTNFTAPPPPPPHKKPWEK